MDGMDSGINALFLIIKVCSANFKLFQGIWMARTAASAYCSLLKYALQASSCSKIPVEGKDSSISILFLIIKVCSASFQLFQGIWMARTAASVYCSLLLKYALQASSCSKVSGWLGQQHQCIVPYY